MYSSKKTAIKKYLFLTIGRLALIACKSLKISYISKCNNLLYENRKRFRSKTWNSNKNFVVNGVFTNVGKYKSAAI